jgi:ABC-type branched-subunit amino acid transport system substrate-binding protein
MRLPDLSDIIFPAMSSRISFFSQVVISPIVFFLFCVSVLSSFAEEPPYPDGGGDKVAPAIGCVQPLSGRYGVVGEAALRGVLTAAGVFTSKRGTKVIAVDVGEGGGRLKESFSKIAEEGGVRFIVGPILPEVASGAEDAAYSLKVPTLVFPLSETDFLENPYLVRFGYPIEAQARVLANFATRYLKAGSFAVIYPDTRPGRILKETFTKAVSMLQARVVSVSSARSFMEDFDAEVKWLKSSSPDAIFIPDGAGNSARLISRLKAEGGFDGVVFLGPSSWNSDAFVKNLGGVEDGVYFTDYFHVGSPRWEYFHNRYIGAFDGEPGFVEYQVFEGTSVLAEFIDRFVDPLGIIEGIRNRGNTSFYKVEGSAEAGLTIIPNPMVLTVRGGRIVSIPHGVP